MDATSRPSLGLVGIRDPFEREEWGGTPSELATVVGWLKAKDQLAESIRKQGGPPPKKEEEEEGEDANQDDPGEGGGGGRGRGRPRRKK